MKKRLIWVLTIGLMIASLSACGKNNPEQEIKRIEASNAAESKEPTERKYEDTNKEPVIAPDRNSKQEVDSDNTPNAEENTIIERDPTIYGIWSSTDNSNLTIFNSSAGIKFIMYDAPSDSYITGDVTTDNSTYIEMKYLKPVEQAEPTEPVEEQPIEDDSTNPYGSDEELYAALEAEHEAQYETVKYSIDKNEFNQETSTMLLTITGNGKTLEMSTQITPDTPDYSKEDNELALDMVSEDNNEKEEAIEEEVIE